MSKQGATGTLSVTIKSKRKTLAVKDTPLVVSMDVKNHQSQNQKEFKCGWWSHITQSLVTDDCTLAGSEKGLLTCSCTHLTDFLGV